MESEVICCIIEIKYFSIVEKSLGSIVFNDFFCAFSTNVFTNKKESVGCRSPPIIAIYRFALNGGFYMKDIVLARFIKYMEVVLVHRRIDYIKKLSKIKEYEGELKDYQENQKFISEKDYSILDFLNKKERELFEMLYIKGFTYKEISKMTNVSVKALELRRYRAVQKLKDKMGEL